MDKNSRVSVSFKNKAIRKFQNRKIAKICNIVHNKVHVPLMKKLTDV